MQMPENCEVSELMMLRCNDAFSQIFLQIFHRIKFHEILPSSHIGPYMNMVVIRRYDVCSFVSKVFLLWQIAFWCQSYLYDHTFKQPTVRLHFIICAIFVTRSLKVKLFRVPRYKFHNLRNLNRTRSRSSVILYTL